MSASIRRENTMRHFSALALGIALSGATTAWAQPAQAADEHAGYHGAPSPAPAAAPAMPMSGMNHEAMKTGAMPDADGGMKKTHPAAAAGDMAGLDHGDMKMQGGSAPADARDPKAYADGYTLDRGKYALPGTQRLRLADEHAFGAVLSDRLECAYGRDDKATSYEGQAWFGGTYDRLAVKAEGNYADSRLEEARTEVLWGHAIASYWDTQLGVRFDSGEGPNRTWAAFGVQGLPPYWFELDVTGYVGNEGRTALR
ncbi:copper resistance protein B, partial [Accumulibacter sp.]|uniref:copper resistance protein B n=1 Tax=Accumulibacter sp. TaxID=2053492 RepID=UPI0028C39988